MRTQRIYLETTMFNYFLDTERGEMHTATVELFKEIKAGKFDAYTSVYVIDELSKAPEPKRAKMFELVDLYKIKMIPAEAEAVRLSKLYVSEKIVPQKFATDALHIAIAAVKEIDIILSFNFSHINNYKTKDMVSVINTREGYNKSMKICSAMEVIDHE
jgi:predicted nucleic acid-binding protein